MKIFIGLIVIVFGVGYFSGLLGGGQYSRLVDRPPAAVAAGLAGLDILSDTPGGIKMDPAESGGVIGDIRMEQAGDHITWYVMSGDKVATKMTAMLQPMENGTKTRVTASVERGDAPDDFVVPVFRSERMTLGLFSVALESNLDRLTAPAMASAETCDQLMLKFRHPGAVEGGMIVAPRSENLKQAIGETSNSIMRIAAMQQQLRAHGCPMGFDGPGMSKASEEYDPDRPRPEPTNAFRPEDNADPRRGDQPHRFGDPTMHPGGN